MWSACCKVCLFLLVFTFSSSCYALPCLRALAMSALTSPQPALTSEISEFAQTFTQLWSSQKPQNVLRPSLRLLKAFLILIFNIWCCKFGQCRHPLMHLVVLLRHQALCSSAWLLWKWAEQLPSQVPLWSFCRHVLIWTESFRRENGVWVRQLCSWYIKVTCTCQARNWELHALC